MLLIFAYARHYMPTGLGMTDFGEQWDCTIKDILGVHNWRWPARPVSPGTFPGTVTPPPSHKSLEAEALQL